ncbi:DUF308 domain-containing protein [Algoriphagus lutimaris]|uniref:HdeD family acid-resistance protein n=1 Tax=Algoriphagus lutimaris TaxID=613197 RepID=UPI00196A5D46|nr:DUF308 domain-containing protein [Algoriphagus lutimaris]MBN3519351.1 DUF308 domain-containing protein [Algoriphagus lutimaris]
MEFSNKYWWLGVLKGIVFIILAFFVFRHPLDTLLGLAIYIGISFLFTGIMEIIGSFTISKLAPKWGWILVGGILDLIFGIIFLSNPLISASTIPFVIGIWLMVRGIFLFVDSFGAKKSGVPNWGLMMIGGIIISIFGYSISFNMLMGVLTVTSWMGFGLLIIGVFSIIEGFGLKPKS